MKVKDDNKLKEKYTHGTSRAPIIIIEEDERVDDYFSNLEAESKIEFTIDVQSCNCQAIKNPCQQLEKG